MANEILPTENRIQEEDEPEEGEIQDNGSLEDVSSAEEVTPSLNQKYKRSYQDYRLSFKDSCSYKPRSTISRQRSVPVLRKRKSRSHNSSSNDEDKALQYRQIKIPSVGSYHMRLKPLINPEHDIDARYDEQLLCYSSSKAEYKDQVADIAQEKENREDSRDVPDVKKNHRKRRYSLLQVSDKKLSSSSDTDNEIEFQRKNEVNGKKLKEHDPKPQKKAHFKKKSSKEMKEKHHSSRKKTHKNVIKKYCVPEPSISDDHIQESSLKKRLEAMLAVTHYPNLSPKRKDNDETRTLETVSEDNLVTNVNPVSTSEAGNMNVQVPRNNDLCGREKENLPDVEILEVPRIVFIPEVITLDDSDVEAQSKNTVTSQNLDTENKPENVEHEIQEKRNDGEIEGKIINDDDDLLELRRLALESNKRKEFQNKQNTDAEVDDVLELRLNALRSAYLKKHMERKQRGLALKQKTASSSDTPFSALSPLNSPTDIINSEILSLTTEVGDTLSLSPPPLPPPPLPPPLPGTPPLPPEPVSFIFSAPISSPPPLPTLPPLPPISAIEEVAEADESTAIIDMDLAHTDDEQSCESLPTLGDGFIVISDSEAHERDVSTLLTGDNISASTVCEGSKQQNEPICLKEPNQMDSSLLLEGTWNSLSDTYKYSDVHPYSVSEFNPYPEQYEKSNDGGSLDHQSANIPQEYFLNQHSTCSPKKLERVSMCASSSSAVSYTDPYFVSTSEFAPRTLTTENSSNISATELNTIPIISRPTIKPTVHLIWNDMNQRPNLRNIPVDLQENVFPNQEPNEAQSEDTLKLACAKMEQDEDQALISETIASDSVVDIQHSVCPQQREVISRLPLPDTLMTPCSVPTPELSEETMTINSTASVLGPSSTNANNILIISQPIIKQTVAKCWKEYKKVPSALACVTKSISENQEDLTNQQNYGTSKKMSVELEPTVTVSRSKSIEESDSKCDSENEESCIAPEIDLSSMIVLDEVGPCSSPEENLKIDASEEMLHLNDVHSDAATQERLKAIQLEVDNLDDDEQILRARVLTSLSKKHKKVTSPPLISHVKTCSDTFMLSNRKPLPKSQKGPKRLWIRTCTVGSSKDQVSDKLSSSDPQAVSGILKSKSVLRKQRILNSSLSSNSQNKKVNVLRFKSSTSLNLIPRISKPSLQVTIPTDNGNKLGRKRKVATHTASNQRFVIHLGEDTDSGEDEVKEQETHGNMKRHYGTDSTSPSSTPPNTDSLLTLRKQVYSGSDSEMLSHHSGDSKQPCVPVDFEKRVDMLLKQVRLQQEEMGEKMMAGYRGLKAKTPTVLQTAVALDKGNSNASSATPLGIRLLPSSKQEEYRRLKQQLAIKEKQKQQQLGKKYFADDTVIHRGSDENRIISMTSHSPASIKINVANNVNLLRKQMEIGKQKCSAARSALSIHYDATDTIELSNISAERAHLKVSSNEGENIIKAFPPSKNIDKSPVRNAVNGSCNEILSLVPHTESISDQFLLDKEVGTLRSSIVSNCEGDFVRSDLENISTKHKTLLVNSTTEESEDLQNCEVSEINCTSRTAEATGCQAKVENNFLGLSTSSHIEKCEDPEKIKAEVVITKEPTQVPLEMLQQAESSLLTQRYSVLDDLTEMMQQLRQMDLERNVKSECISEVRRLRSELGRAEERLAHQNELMLSIRMQISQAHQRMVRGRRECATLGKTCMELGVRRVGRCYKVPYGGAGLMKAKLQQFANYTRNVKLGKKKGNNASKLRKLNLGCEEQCVDGSLSSEVKLSNSELMVDTNANSALLTTSSEVCDDDVKFQRNTCVDLQDTGTLPSKQCVNVPEEIPSSDVRESCSVEIAEVYKSDRTETSDVSTEISGRDMRGSCLIAATETAKNNLIGQCLSVNTRVLESDLSKPCLSVTTEISRNCTTDPSELQVSKKQVAGSFLARQFHEYRSPLEHMKSKRDESGRNELDPLAILCPYALMGSCRDDECPYHHQDIV